MIQITPEAAEQVRRIMREQGQESAGVRLSVIPSGCSGLEYKMDFAPRPGINDRSFQIEGLKVIVDSNSVAYLQGVVLDWGKGLLGTGFKFSNPNAASSCGCGKSFSV